MPETIKYMLLLFHDAPTVMIPYFSYCYGARNMTKVKAVCVFGVLNVCGRARVCNIEPQHELVHVVTTQYFLLNMFSFT